MSDLISRQAAIDALHMHLMYRMGTDSNKKRLDDWINSLPSAQETHDKRTETHECDLIGRQEAIDALKSQLSDWNDDYNIPVRKSIENIERLPSAQPDLDEWCPDCKEYDSKRHCCPRFNRVIRGALKDVQSHWTPCDWCKYNPPSSMDGKPCTICPAVGKGENE